MNQVHSGTSDCRPSAMCCKNSVIQQLLSIRLAIALQQEEAEWCAQLVHWTTAYKSPSFLARIVVRARKSDSRAAAPAGRATNHAMMQSTAIHIAVLPN